MVKNQAFRALGLVPAEPCEPQTNKNVTQIATGVPESGLFVFFLLSPQPSIILCIGFCRLIVAEAGLRRFGSFLNIGLPKMQHGGFRTKSPQV